MFIRREYDSLLATCFKSIGGLLVPSHPAPEYLAILVFLWPPCQRESLFYPAGPESESLMTVVILPLAILLDTLQKLVCVATFSLLEPCGSRVSWVPEGNQNSMYGTQHWN